MKILSAAQIREADRITIELEPISTIDLMERASQQCVNWISENFPSDSTFHVFCGMGNNGGDGLAIARLLHERALTVKCSIVRFSEFGSPDFNTNKERLFANGISCQNITRKNDIPVIQENVLVIDAIFGSGLNRPTEGIVLELIQKLNASPNKVISIDMPSGLFSEDNNTNNLEGIIRANYTLTFQVPKLALVLPENALYVGIWNVLNIGLNTEFIDSCESKYHYSEHNNISRKLLVRSKYSHKGSFGHVLLVSGMKGKIGATILSARACLRSGVGLLSIHAPNCAYEILQESVPEAMVDVNEGEEHLKGICFPNENIVAVGPGIGTAKDTERFLKSLLKNTTKSMVIDADAINIIAENKGLLTFVPPKSIFTPHPGEFKRLVGTFQNDIEKLEMLQAFCNEHDCTMVLKGAHTAVCTPDGNIQFNSTGNTGMATGGSGDVLTGLIAGLLAQGHSPKDAAVIGVYIHGLAGDLAAIDLSERAMIASDIIANIGKAFLTFQED